MHHLTVFRVILGTYLFSVFARLIPWGADLYSRVGLLADFRHNPTHAFVPFNPLYHWDAPLVVQGVLAALALLALLLALGVFPRVAAGLLWLGWALLWHRNVFTLNPSVPFIGFLLLALLFTPRGVKGPLPRDLARVVWIVVMVGYSWSGITKLASPSWQSGEALGYVLSGPLARDVPWVEALVALPLLTKLLTWGTLALEVLAGPLALSRRLRPLVWLALVGLHLGILATVQFAELTLGMLVVHAFAFDSAWLHTVRRWVGRRAPASTQAPALAAR
jgi:hypothetical protein